MVIWNLLQKVTSNRTILGYATFSFLIFISSLVLLNILYFFINNEKIVAIICLSFIFLCNYIYLVFFFRINKKKSFLIFFLLSSLIFRSLEYFIFSNIISSEKNINVAWIVSLLISFITKHVYYKFFGEKFFISK